MFLLLQIETYHDTTQMFAIDILENNKKFVLKKFKKYTVDEFKEERIKKQQSDRMLEALKNAFMQIKND